MIRISTLLRAVAAVLCLASCAAPALAEDEGESHSRVLRMLGVTGNKDDSTEDSGVSVNSGETQSKVLQWLGLSRRRGGDGGDAKSKGLVDCPDIVVEGGRAELRAPPDAAASEVRYQLSITRMARECSLNGDEVAVRVGLQGAAVLGPAGQAGAYSGNLRVALRRKSDDKVFDEKTHHVGATIPAGASRGDFTLLVEDLSAPFISAKAADDYEVVVGFVSDSSSPAARSKRRGGG